MMKNTFFITGTDTGVGKTTITVGLLNALNHSGYAAIGLKPIASGVDERGNEDALAIQAASALSLTYDQINPICFTPPIAPHIAAAQCGAQLSAADIAQFCQQANQLPADHLLIEGAGGWLVPLNHRETYADVVKLLNIPIILVVGMRLGCLNHALLTVQAIKDAGLQLHGWVANFIDSEMAAPEENLATLSAMIDAPMLFSVPYQADDEYFLENARLYLI